MNALATRQDTTLESWLQARREALLVELRAVEKMLGIEPKERVICPQCRKERNKAA